MTNPEIGFDPTTGTETISTPAPPFIPPPPPPPVISNPLDDVGPASGEITPGMPVYMTADGKWAHASAASLATARVLGLAITHALDGEAVTVRTGGPVDLPDNDWHGNVVLGYGNGDQMFLTAGGLIANHAHLPGDPGECIVSLGVWVDRPGRHSTLFLRIGEPKVIA